MRVGCFSGPGDGGVRKACPDSDFHFGFHFVCHFGSGIGFGFQADGPTGDPISCTGWRAAHRVASRAGGGGACIAAARPGAYGR